MAACGGVSSRSRDDSGSGGTAGTAGSVTSSGGSNAAGAGGAKFSSSAGSSTTGPCDPQLIGPAVLDRENKRISWIDAYLNGEVSLYRGPWSVDRVISRDGTEPESTRLAFPNALATFMRNFEAVFLEVLYPDLPVPALLKQPFAQPGTTRFILYTYSSDWMSVERECEGCLADFGSQPNLVAADALVLSPGSGDEVTLNMEFRRVPKEALTSEDLVAFATDDLQWRRESDQWVAAECDYYQGPGRSNFPAAYYRADYVIDDADPRVHGVRGITVLTCDETCNSPEYEGDYCPPLPYSALCE